MAKANFCPSDDRFIRGIIRRKIKQLIGRAGFTRDDCDDLEQEMLARVLQSLPQFDPNRAHRNRFVTTVVERYVANILRNKRAEKRDFRRICSIDHIATLDGKRSTEVMDHCRVVRDQEELTQLAIDVADLLAELPDHLRSLAERLKMNSISAIARETAVPRTTLYGQIHRLRQVFESKGLSEYL